MCFVGIVGFLGLFGVGCEVCQCSEVDVVVGFCVVVGIEGIGCCQVSYVYYVGVIGLYVVGIGFDQLVVYIYDCVLMFI